MNLKVRRDRGLDVDSCSLQGTKGNPVREIEKVLSEIQRAKTTCVVSQELKSRFYRTKTHCPPYCFGGAEKQDGFSTGLMASQEVI